MRILVPMDNRKSDNPQSSRPQLRREKSQLTRKEMKPEKHQETHSLAKPTRAISCKVRAKSKPIPSHLTSQNMFCEKLTGIRDLYGLREEIGKGASGTVRRCRDKLIGENRAIKMIPKASLSNDLEVENLKSEIKTLQFMQCHPAVVRLHGIHEDRDNLHLAMGFCEGGDLFSRIKKKGFFPESEAASVCRVLASVLNFAHKNGIMHRDLKPENVLMVSKHSDTDVQLADFGSSATFRKGQKLNQLVGSPLYISPTVLQNSYGTEADLWSLGVVLYILLSGVPPFWGKSNPEIFRKIQREPLNLEHSKIRNISSEAKHLLSLLLTRKPEERISAAQVLDHPWIVRHCGNTRTLLMSCVVRESSFEAVEGSSGVDNTMAERKLGNKIGRRHSDGGFAAAQCADDARSEFSEDRSVLMKTVTPFHSSSAKSTHENPKSAQGKSKAKKVTCRRRDDREMPNALANSHEPKFSNRQLSFSDDEWDIPIAEVVYDVDTFYFEPSQ